MRNFAINLVADDFDVENRDGEHRKRETSTVYRMFQNLACEGIIKLTEVNEAFRHF